MKKILFLISAMFLALSAGAQDKDKDPEADHVKVTLTDGTVKEGYVQKYWVEGKLFKRMNTSFTMSPLPDGKNAEQYDADNVSCIDFVRKVSTDGRFDHLESHIVANPSTFKPGKTQRQFVYKEVSNSAGTIYWWNSVDSQNMQLGKINISTIYGICLTGDSVVVPFMTGNVISLNAMRIRYKKTNSGLVDYVDNRVLKGGKPLWDTIAAEPMLFLEICKEYLARQKR